MMQKFSLIKPLLAICVCLICGSSFAAGLYNDLQSTSAMGNAFAGAGAAGDDISIMQYNPAGLALFDDEEAQLVVSGIYAFINTEFTVDSATDTTGAIKHNIAGKEYSVVPNKFSPAIYVASPLWDRFVLGASLTSRYELNSDYTDTVVSNTARETNFIAYTGSLTLAMEVIEQLSLGITGNLQYFKAKMNADLEATDDRGNMLTGSTQYTGTDVAFYPSFGLLYEFSEDTRLGLNYRMHVDQNTHGEFSTTFITPSLSETEVFDATSLFLFPDLYSLNLYHKPLERVEVLADLMYTRWSRFKNIVVPVVNENGNTEVIINSPIDLKDSWRFGFGVNYIFNPGLKLRTGIAFDESPVDDSNRTLQGPDSNRFDVAIGLMLQPEAWERTHIDIAYMHTFFQDGTVSQENPLFRILPPSSIPPGTDLTSAAGSVTNSANGLGVQLVYSM